MKAGKRFLYNKRRFDCPGGRDMFVLREQSGGPEPANRVFKFKF